MDQFNKMTEGRNFVKIKSFVEIRSFIFGIKQLRAEEKYEVVNELNMYFVHGEVGKASARI